jgi:hypothetical protein
VARTPAYGFAKPHERLHAVPRVLDDIVAWAPRAWSAKSHNGGAAKEKDPLFLAHVFAQMQSARSA